MKIAVGADHAGFELKEHLRRVLESEGHEVRDLGIHAPERSDYPDVARRVAQAAADGEVERGLLVCGTGVGMAIAANKVRGVRAACCNDLFVARLARAHNDINVLTIGGRVIGSALAESIVHAFLAVPFDGGRHAARLDKIAACEAARG